GDRSRRSLCRNRCRRGILDPAAPPTDGIGFPLPTETAVASARRGSLNPAAPPPDRVGLPLPTETAPAFASLSVFEAVDKLHAQLVELVDQLAQVPGGAACRQHLVRKLKEDKLIHYSPELQLFGQKFASAPPHCGYCPRRHARHAGRVHPACKLCAGRGWLTKGEFEACPEHEWQELRRLHVIGRFKTGHLWALQNRPGK
ncbi:MAG TPA: hypothetical protein VG013_21650, partial [Gemmataceae bacterium]|nr:hypothetical protein [Gemmataceae bacterium]